MEAAPKAHNYRYPHIISNFELSSFDAGKPLEPNIKRHIYSYVETISNLVQIISNYAEITSRPDATSDRHYYKERGSDDKPAHVHNVTVLLTEENCWKQHEIVKCHVKIITDYVLLTQVSC